MSNVKPLSYYALLNIPEEYFYKENVETVLSGYAPFYELYDEMLTPLCGTREEVYKMKKPQLVRCICIMLKNSSEFKRHFFRYNFRMSYEKVSRTLRRLVDNDELTEIAKKYIIYTRRIREIWIDDYMDDVRNVVRNLKNEKALIKITRGWLENNLLLIYNVLTESGKDRNCKITYEFINSLYHEDELRNMMKEYFEPVELIEYSDDEM